MALIKCKECGNEISKKAKKCPNCGAPTPKPMFSTGGVILFAIIGWLVYSSYDSPPDTLPSNPPPSNAIPAAPLITSNEKILVQNLSSQPIPSDVIYSIISDKDFQQVRRTINVRLNKKVSKGALKTIATQLKGLERLAFERTFIIYYLPDMKVGSGAWATTYYDPNLVVKILGLTLEAEEKMIQEAKNITRDIVGIWKDENPYVPSTVTLYRDAGKLYLATKYKDGSSSVEEMAESDSENGTKLVEKGGNRFGEYFILDRQKNLHAGGKNGIFRTYKKVQ